jgi:tryptophan synthase alpha chain
VNLASALAAARRERRTILVPYLMVDRRRRALLRSTVQALRDAGATALELGFPFSDPIADGPVLEAAAGRALSHGTAWTDLLTACRTASEILPTAVMTYANPVWRRGLDRAASELSRAGASGLIVPDLSLEESVSWTRATRRHGVSLVLLAAPGVSSERIRRIARASRGFLYLVSRYGTTGVSTRGTTVDLKPLVDAAHRAAPDLPVLIGFGVRDPASAARAVKTGADGVVVGSALEERLERNQRPAALARWLASIARGARVPR